MKRTPLHLPARTQEDDEFDALYYGDPTSSITGPTFSFNDLLTERRDLPFVTDDIHYWKPLLAAGVRFPRQGPHLRPPWYAEHDLLPGDFETPHKAESEDAKKRQWLRYENSPQALILKNKLADCPRMQPCATLASTQYFRFRRVAFLAGALQKMKSVGERQLSFITLVPPAFFVEAGHLDPISHGGEVWKSRIRKHLTGAGLGECGGFVIGGLHADFECDAADAHAGYQIHFHLICDEAAAEVIERLKTKPAYEPTKWVPRPHVVKPVESLPGALTYLVKSYWLNRARRGINAPASLVRDGSRLAPAQMAECLAWLDGQRFADLVFTHRFILPPFAKKSGW